MKIFSYFFDRSKIKKKYTYIFSTILFGLLLFCQSFLVLADNEYSISEASFEVEINEDGSARVHEQWKVKFIEGSFSRFYKDISFERIPAEEDFSEIADVSVWIDGTECEPTDDSAGRSDYHYHLSSKYPGARLSAYVNSSYITRTYDFYYTLKDSVKYVDDSYHLFAFRFIDANFSKRVDFVKIHVTAPEGATAKILYSTNGDTSENGNEVFISTKNNFGMYKLRLRMDGAVIPGASIVSSSDLDKTVFRKSSDQTKKSVTLNIICAIGIAAILFERFKSSIVKSKSRKDKGIVRIDIFFRKIFIRNSLKNDGMASIYKTVSELEKVLEPTEIVSIADFEGPIFPLHLAYMVSRGLVLQKIDADNQVILKLPADYQTRTVSPADKYAYSVLAKFMDENATAIALQKLTDKVTDKFYVYYINKNIHDILKKQVKDKEVTKSEELKKKIKWLRAAGQTAKKKGLVPSVSFEKLFNSRISSMDAINYQMNPFHPVSDHETNTGYYFWDDFSARNAESYAQYIRNHSNRNKYSRSTSADFLLFGSGDDTSYPGACSSCSGGGCSGCGGGGAD